MNKRKHHKADLESKRSLFFQIGLIISSLIVLSILEWSTPTTKTATVYLIDDIKMETNLLYINPTDKVNKQTPKSLNKLNIISDNNSINENNKILSTQLDSKQTTLKSTLEQKNKIETPTLWIAPTMPKFPGGKIGLQQYITKHLKYPKKAIENDIQGKVFVKFIVDIKGNIKNASVVYPVHPLLDKEALRVVKNIPKWQAGQQNGKAVNVWITIPVVFQI